jgi:hypothetical protein
MKYIIKSFIAIMCIAVLTLASDARAQGQPTSAQLDGTLETLKSMPPEQRQQILNAAMENFKNMPPEQRAQMISEASARVQNLTEEQKKAYEAQWQNTLTLEQKQQMMNQLQAQGVAVPASAPAPAPAQTNAADVMQQINSLPPEQRQKLLDALKSQPQ